MEDGLTSMTQERVRRRPAWWLLPLGLALPFAAAMVWALCHDGPQVKDLLSIALKMVVIP